MIIGRRNARERTAHLLLDFEARLSVIDRVRNDRFDLPINQADLADSLGVTVLHLNRTMRALRSERMIRTVSQTVIIENWPAMEAVGDLTPPICIPKAKEIRRFCRISLILAGFRSTGGAV